MTNAITIDDIKEALVQLRSGPIARWLILRTDLHKGHTPEQVAARAMHNADLLTVRIVACQHPPDPYTISDMETYHHEFKVFADWPIIPDAVIEQAVESALADGIAVEYLIRNCQIHPAAIRRIAFRLGMEDPVKVDCIVIPPLPFTSNPLASFIYKSPTAAPKSTDLG